MKKILKNYIVCLITGSFFLLASIIFAPIWNWWDSCPWKDWGSQIVNILIAACIICYLVFFLAKKLNHGKRVIKVLTIVEFAILSLIALSCIFGKFITFINLKEIGPIFGLALWTRGCVELFRAYYYRADSKEHYPVWYLAISIALVTLGTYSFAKPFIKNIFILWLFVGSLLVGGIILLIVGFNNKPAKKTKARKAIESSEE